MPDDGIYRRLLAEMERDALDTGEAFDPAAAAELADTLQRQANLLRGATSAVARAEAEASTERRKRIEAETRAPVAPPVPADSTGRPSYKVNVRRDMNDLIQTMDMTAQRNVDGTAMGPDYTVDVRRAPMSGLIRELVINPKPAS